MARLERSLREHLSDWKFWIGVAYFGIAMTVVALVVLFNRTAREEASRAASGRAAAVSQVSTCFTAVKNAPVTFGFIDSHEAIIDNGLIANKAAITAAPGDPLNVVRRQSIVRLEAAKKNANQLRDQIFESTPTQTKCVQLAHTLSVDPSRYLTKSPH